MFRFNHEWAVGRRQECPWPSNASLSAARRLHNVAHRRALKSGSSSDWALYRKLRNKANTMLQLAKAEYFSDLASSLRAKPDKFWKRFQSLSRCSRSVGGTQAAVTADDFNVFFLSIHVPYKTVANVVSTVSPTVYMDRLFDVGQGDRTIICNIAATSLFVYRAYISF